VERPKTRSERPSEINAVSLMAMTTKFHQRLMMKPLSKRSFRFDKYEIGIYNKNTQQYKSKSMSRYNKINNLEEYFKEYKKSVREPKKFWDKIASENFTW
jgi:hypothetical protein